MGQEEQLFELVDDEEQLAVVVGQELLRHPQQSPVVGHQFAQHPVLMAHAHPQQCRFELLEGIRAGEHVGHQHRPRPAA